MSVMCVCQLWTRPTNPFFTVTCLPPLLEHIYTRHRLMFFSFPLHCSMFSVCVLCTAVTARWSHWTRPQAVSQETGCMWRDMNMRNWEVLLLDVDSSLVSVSQWSKISLSCSYSNPFSSPHLVAYILISKHLPV